MTTQPSASDYRNLLLRFIISMALAFPLSGVTLYLVSMVRDPSLLLTNPKGELIAFIIVSVWYGIVTPICGGFPFDPETGINRTNMYPYIIPTGLVIFFFFWRGWRKKNTTAQAKTINIKH